jgi:hypothetical protein
MKSGTCYEENQAGRKHVGPGSIEYIKTFIFGFNEKLNTSPNKL